MVSGAAHTRRTPSGRRWSSSRPATASRSSPRVFLMLMPDRVLVYGDCAVNPEPNVEQLADIALASAETAAQFGVEPRVAMLSYSTGGSGAGEAVDAVRQATELVRARRPDLAVEGPIQYDAAVDAAIAESKMPGRPSRGRRPSSSSRTSTPATTPTRRSSSPPGRSPSGPCCRACASRSTTSPAAAPWRTSSTRWPSPPSRRSPRSRPPSRPPRPPMPSAGASAVFRFRRAVGVLLLGGLIGQAFRREIQVLRGSRGPRGLSPVSAALSSPCHPGPGSHLRRRWDPACRSRWRPGVLRLGADAAVVRAVWFVESWKSFVSCPVAPPSLGARRGFRNDGPPCPAYL